LQISILSPVYNVPEEYLRRSINSMIGQTLKDIEIILIDDGSTDSHSTKICDEYARLDNRIKVVHQKNGGPSFARNTALKMAEGEYITFVDSDDWIDPHACAELYNIAKTENFPLVIFGAVQEFPNSSKPFSYSIEDKARFDSRGCIGLQRQLLDFYSNIAAPWGKLVKRSLLSDYSILYDNDLRLGEGIYFWMQVFDVLDRAMFVSTPYYHYRYNDTSISQSYNEKNIYNTVEAFARIGAFIERSPHKCELVPVFQNRFIYTIITTAISGYFNPANRESYRTKKAKYCNYLRLPLVDEILKSRFTAGLSLDRRIAYFLIKKHFFLPLVAIAFLRKLQRKNL